jgi:hypothetical protein
MRLLAFVFTLTLAACGAQPNEEFIDIEALQNLEQGVDHDLPLIAQAYSIKSSELCEKEGGTWKQSSSKQSAICVLPASDAGNVCSDSSQCTVACVTKSDNVVAGTKVEGMCLESTDLFNCPIYVSKGVAEQSMCAN